MFYVDAKGDKKGMNKFVLEILGNIKVKIERAYIRIEDPEFPYALGILFHDIGVKTCDENWNVVNFLRHPEYMWKSVYLNDFSLFLDREKERCDIDRVLKTHEFDYSKEDKKTLGYRIY
jgi:hypothetical protein